MSQVVYVSRKRKPGTVVRYKLHGLQHRQVLYGGRWRTEIKIGHKWRVVMNAELPRQGDQYIAHPQDGVCEKCGYIYSHLMRNAGQPCDECRLERIARRAEALHRLLGLNLGWPDRDPVSERIVYGYKEPIRFGMREAW